MAFHDVHELLTLSISSTLENVTAAMRSPTLRWYLDMSKLERSSTKALALRWHERNNVQSSYSCNVYILAYVLIKSCHKQGVGDKLINITFSGRKYLIHSIMLAL